MYYLLSASPSPTVRCFSVSTSSLSLACIVIFESIINRKVYLLLVCPIEINPRVVTIFTWTFLKFQGGIAQPFFLTMFKSIFVQIRFVNVVCILKFSVLSNALS